MEILSPWFLLAAVGFLAGIFSTLFLQKPAAKLWKRLNNRARLIKRYWSFAIPFSLIYFGVLAALYFFAPKDNLGELLNITGQVFTILFAIFVGYFAFAQVIESRKDKFIERAANNAHRKFYVEAMKDTEQAHLIDPKDVGVLGTFMEFSLVTGRPIDWEEKMKMLQKNSIDPRTKIVPLYLETARQLFKGHIHDAYSSIQATVELVKSNPSIIPHPSWTFVEILDSDPYHALSGDTKKAFDNYILYIQRRLGANEARFEAGNYPLA